MSEAIRGGRFSSSELEFFNLAGMLRQSDGYFLLPLGEGVANQERGLYRSWMQNEAQELYYQLLHGMRIRETYRSEGLSSERVQLSTISD